MAVAQHNFTWRERPVHLSYLTEPSRGEKGRKIKACLKEPVYTTKQRFINLQ
jgi:hypothetical protein